MIIYIHGFGGSGKGVKAELFRSYYHDNNQKFIAPSLSYVPDLAISTLEELIESCDNKPKLIGSSLGGYYAIYLSDRYNLKTVLINPSTKPVKTLPKFLEDKFATNWYDLSSFEVTQKHLNMLKKYEVKTPKEENFLLLLQKDDDVIDYRVADSKFKISKKIITTGGGHSFDGVEEYFKDIDSFLG